MLTESARNYPSNTAVIFNDVKLSYAELNDAANKFANAIGSAGIKPGQRVALMLPNIPQFMICYYGLLKAGCVVVPLNVQFKRREMAYHLQDSEAVALVVWEDFIEEASAGYLENPTCKSLIVVNKPGSQALPEIRGATSFDTLLATASPISDTYPTAPEDTAVILYTSGTTGLPKGAELTHANMFFNATVVVRHTGLDFTPEDVLLLVLPLFHSFGQSACMNAAVLAGTTVTLMTRFEAGQTFELLQRDKVTIFAGVPTMYFYLLNHAERAKYDLSSLRSCISGGSALPMGVLQGWLRATGIQILEGYGLSETSPVASFNVTYKPTKPGSIGLPVWGTEMRVVDFQGNPLPVGEVGELVVRGHNVMKGYLNQSIATAEVLRDGWLHTGDLGKVDADGYFYVVDRLKDVILRGGFNVYPREVEELLYGHPAIAECAVVGVPDPALGEEIKAVVVLKPGRETTEDELKDYCRARIASSKCPRIVQIWPETLPKNATGKIIKRELKASKIGA